MVTEEKKSGLVGKILGQWGALAQTVYGLTKASAGSSLKYWGMTEGVDIPFVAEYLTSTGVVDTVGGLVRIVRQTRPNKFRNVETWFIGNRKHLATAWKAGKRAYKNSKAGVTLEERFSGMIVPGYTPDQYVQGYLGLSDNDVVKVTINPITAITKSNPNKVLREEVYKGLSPELRQISDLYGGLPDAMKQNPRLAPAFVSPGEIVTPLGNNQYSINALGNVVVPKALIELLRAGHGG